MCPVSVAIGSDVSKQTCEIDVWLAVTLVGDGFIHIMMMILYVCTPY
jgi:hypothetical protein